MAWRSQARRSRAQRVATSMGGADDDDDIRESGPADATGRVVARTAPATHPLSRRSEYVVVGTAPHHRRDHLLLLVHPRAGHRAGSGEPANLRRRNRNIHTTDRGVEGIRAGRPGALPRAQRRPRHPDRLLGAGHPLSAADVVGDRHRVAAGDCSGGGGHRHPHDRALQMNPPDLQLSRGQLAPVRQRNHDRPASLDNPRAPRRRAGMPNFEKYAWLFMRFSGIVLVFLALGHLFVMLMADDGVYRIDFNYVAQRWHSPFWQTWDLLLLWLAQLHGGNGLRTIIDDYSRKDSTRFWLNPLLALSMAFTLVLGTYVLLTFDPNIS